MIRSITCALLLSLCISVVSAQGMLSSADLNSQKELNKYERVELVPEPILLDANNSFTNRGATLYMDSLILHVPMSSGSPVTGIESTTYLYNSINENITSSRFDITPNTQQRIASTKTENVYNANGLLISSISYRWAPGTSTWVELYKYDRIYSSSFNLESLITLRWNLNTSLWDNLLKREYSYDANDNNIGQFLFQWNTSSSLWDSTVKYTYSFDSNNDNTGVSGFNWNGSLWVNILQSTYTLNGLGDRVDQLMQTWDTTSNVWVNFYLYDYSYDTQDNMIQWVRQDWSITQSAWRPLFRLTQSFDLTVSGADIIAPGGYDLNNQLSAESVYYNNPGTGNWEISDSITYFYSTGITSIAESKFMEMESFPNPVTDLITFKLNTNEVNAVVQIMDVTGKVVMKRDLNRANKVNVSILHRGFYTYVIEARNGIYSGKFVK